MRKQTSQLVKLAECASIVSNDKFLQVALTHTLEPVNWTDEMGNRRQGKGRE